MRKNSPEEALFSEEKRKLKKKEWDKNNKDKLSTYYKKYYYANPEKAKNKRKQYYEKNKDIINLKRREYDNRPEVKQRKRKQYRERNRLKNSNFTQDIFLEAFEIQKGLCGICNKKLQIDTYHCCADHDHSLNLPRGILCRQCNTGLGFFKDNITYLKSAIKYLKSPPLGLI